LELFIKYQIPSDLLTYDGDENANGTFRIEQIKTYVNVIKSMIQVAKEDEVKEQ
jgi:hypothetical protein